MGALHITQNLTSVCYRSMCDSMVLLYVYLKMQCKHHVRTYVYVLIH